MSDAKTTSRLTQDQQIRLECVALAYRHDRTTGDVIARATDLEKFVGGYLSEPEQVATPAPVKIGKGAKDKQVEPDNDLI